MTIYEYLMRATQDDARRAGERDRLLREARQARRARRQRPAPAAPASSTTLRDSSRRPFGRLRRAVDQRLGFGRSRQEIFGSTPR